MSTSTLVESAQPSILPSRGGHLLAISANDPNIEGGKVDFPLSTQFVIIAVGCHQIVDARIDLEGSLPTRSDHFRSI